MKGKLLMSFRWLLDEGRSERRAADSHRRERRKRKSSNLTEKGKGVPSEAVLEVENVTFTSITGYMNRLIVV